MTYGQESIQFPAQCVIANSGVWNLSFSRKAAVLDGAQTGESLVTFQVVVPYAGGAEYRVKQTLHCEIVNYDNGPSGRDAVAGNFVGGIAPGNLNGSVFSLTAIGRVWPGANGYCVPVEIDLENHGPDQPEPDRPDSKFGAKIINKGPNKGTAGLEIRGGWYKGIFATPEDILDKFIELFGRFAVYPDGSVQIGAVRLYENNGELFVVRGNGQVVRLT